MPTILFLTIIHGIAGLISMLFRHSDAIQQTDWDFETQSNISFTESTSTFGRPSSEFCLGVQGDEV
ncbi:hypothetical protein B0J14DRAFT_658838 [Halenospora varia]|nr:hypothetical protein B0J14DRAFT_658838 [Halenospora varia]